MPTQHDLIVSNLGHCGLESPLKAKGRTFLDETVRVRFEHDFGDDSSEAQSLSFEKDGPREKIFFDPERTTAAFVTCGGLSPGLNNVIGSGFLELTHNYGVRRILGIRNGYAGLNPNSGFEPITLTYRFVHDIHHLGGTVLGSSRGAQAPSITMGFLEEQEIDILFCIGGDGTQRGAHAIQQEIQRRGLTKSVVGIPKIIDNDVSYAWMSFGYETALEQRMLRRGHALVVVAEGAGQHLFDRDQVERDASGNVRYQDIGIFLRERIEAHFAEREIAINLKYIDPSYIIRSIPASAWDRTLTDRMARSAVHAAMAGKTDVMIGWWNQSIIHVPISTAVTAKKQMPLGRDLWNAVLATTGQPNWPPDA